MNTSNNRRKAETENQLQAALIHLLNMKRPDKISINELCQHAGIHRSSFYRRYQDIYDLLNRVEQTMKQQATHAFFTPHFEEGCTPFSVRCFERMFQFVREHREFYSGLISHKECAVLVEYSTQYIHAEEMAPLIQTARVESPEEKQYRMTYFIGGLNAVVRSWILSEFHISAQELAYIMEKEYQYEVAEIERLVSSKNTHTS